MTSFFQFNDVLGHVSCCGGDLGDISHRTSALSRSWGIQINSERIFTNPFECKLCYRDRDVEFSC